jgi:hypothetical protein
MGHGRFAELVNRESLWRLLVTITLRKAQDLRRHACQQKRGGGKVLGESELLDAVDCAAAKAGLEQVVGREPSPELAVQVAEECRWLLSRLGDATLQSLALLKMEGYTNAEVAARLGAVCARSNANSGSSERSGQRSWHHERRFHGAPGV